ncbi:MAG: methyltransferase domain-containing protein [Patescibacteria group bacterium]
MAGSALLNAKHILAATGVSAGMHVADFGVGRTGHLIFPAAQLVGEEGKVYGVDLLKDALKMLEGRRRQYLVHNIDLIHGDIEAGDLAIPEGSLDRVFLVHTLPVARRHAEIVDEIRRLLKDDGRIVVIDWQPNTKHPVAPQGQFRLHPNQVDLAFAQAGCDVCGQFTPSTAHWGRIYRLVNHVSRG